MTTNDGLSWWERIRFFIRARQRLRAGGARLRDGWFQILQTAVAAGVAWLLTFLILGRSQPEFAPIAAVISLGLAAGERGQRAVELTLGVLSGPRSPTSSCLLSALIRCRAGSSWPWRWRQPCSSAGESSA